MAAVNLHQRGQTKEALARIEGLLANALNNKQRRDAENEKKNLDCHLRRQNHAASEKAAD